MRIADISKRRQSMRTLTVAILCAVIIYAVNSPGAAADKSVMEQRKVNVGGEIVDALAVRFKISNSDLQLLSFEALRNQIGDPGQRDGLTIDEYRDVTGVQLTMSVIYLQKYVPPTLYGLVKWNDKVQNPRASPTWALSGLFCFKPKVVVLGSFAALEQQIKMFPNCIQTGPLLIERGKSKADELRELSADPAKRYFDKPARRQFVCLSGGEIIFGVTSELTAGALATSLQDGAGVATRACDSAISPPSAKKAGLSFGDGEDGSSIIFPYVIGIK